MTVEAMKTIHQINPAPGDQLKHERGRVYDYSHQSETTGRHFVKDDDGNTLRVSDTSRWQATAALAGCVE